MWKLSKDRKDKELRKVFVDSLDYLMQNNEKIVVLEADLGGASGTISLKEKYKDRFIQVGIAEANMIGMACGMSMRGYIPFVHTFAPFSTRRALDQIYIEGAYAKNTINIYGSDPGIYAAVNGGTHSTYDDISIMKSIPDTIVLAPADSVCFDWCIKELSKLKGVHYIRANRKANPKIYEDGSRFELGKGNVLVDGNDVVIFSMGGIILHALEAAEELNIKHNINCKVIDMFSIKPIDEKLVKESILETKLAVTFENHSIIGGLGSSVAEIIADNGLNAKLVRIGNNNRFGQVGDAESQRLDYGLTKENIISKVLDNISR